MKFINYCRSCSSNTCTTRPAILAPFMTDRIFGMKPETTSSLYGLPNQVNYLPCKSLICETCGFVGVNILFDDEEMSNLYRGYRGDEYNKVRLSYEPTYQNDVFDARHEYVDEVSQPFIEKHVSNIETLIDFGGYDGLNTPKIGTQRYVYDICDIESEVPITEKLFNCDLITCMHVLEHVPNPNVIIEEIKGSAKYYYFEVPKESNVANKEFWHEHINCFTMDSFSHLLSKHFRIIAKKEDKFLHVLCEDIR
jgi:hypothetical protein